MTSLQVIDQDKLYLAPMTPAEQVTLATDQANALRGVVDQQGLFTMISGKKHLRAEAWQTIASFDNASFETEYCNHIVDADTEGEAYVAKVNITKHGEVLASGIMICGFEEFPCRGKTGYGKHRAAMSAAQTWAGAKAARMRYAWVVTLAGYEPTPAEEMQDGSAPPVQAPPKPKPSTQPKPKPSEKLQQLNQARFDQEGTEVYSGDEIAQAIRDNPTFGGRGPRDLTDAELDGVIESVLAGQVPHAGDEVSTPELVQGELVDSEGEPIEA